MFYRLPFLFSISFYIILLLAQITLFGLVFDSQYFNIYHICLTALNDLTSFFFIFILSNILFYKNKIYFYIRKNKLCIIFLSAIFVVIYLVIDYLLLKLSTSLFLRQFSNLYTEYNYYHSLNSYAMLYSWIHIITNVWLLIFSGVIFYFFVKWGKFFLQIPLIDGITRSHESSLIVYNQLNSNINDQEHCNFYAIIFSSVFCCIINGLVWNCYFNFISFIDEVKFMFNDYYVTIFTFTFISLILNYIFLYYISFKFIKTRPLFSISSLLFSSVITVILFIFLMVMITFFIMPFFFTLNFIVIFIIWLFMYYLLLYFLTQFILTRYFT